MGFARLPGRLARSHPIAAAQRPRVLRRRSIRRCCCGRRERA